MISEISNHTQNYTSNHPYITKLVNKETGEECKTADVLKRCNNVVAEIFNPCSKGHGLKVVYCLDSNLQVFDIWLDPGEKQTLHFKVCPRYKASQEYVTAFLFKVASGQEAYDHRRLQKLLYAPPQSLFPKKEQELVKETAEVSQETKLCKIRLRQDAVVLACHLGGDWRTAKGVPMNFDKTPITLGLRMFLFDDVQQRQVSVAPPGGALSLKIKNVNKNPMKLDYTVTYFDGLNRHDVPQGLGLPVKSRFDNEMILQPEEEATYPFTVPDGKGTLKICVQMCVYPLVAGAAIYQKIMLIPYE